MAKVFISHRGSDIAPARQLAGDLRALRHEVWLDEDELRVGDSILAKMNEGLAEADALVMLFSDDPSAGAWMDREWLSTLARQLEGDGIKILPARIGSSAGPALLRDIKAANLAKNWDAGVAELAAALSRT